MADDPRLTRSTLDAPAVEALARRVAARALVDVRTVRRELLRPGIIRGIAGARIREALAIERAGESERLDTIVPRALDAVAERRRGR